MKIAAATLVTLALITLLPRSAQAANHHRRRHKVVAVARSLIGIPYVWGGSSPRTGFDCSGLVQYVFFRVGVRLPHSTWGQMRFGRRVRHLEAGDVVFFWQGDHVAIYLGGGRIEDAPHTGLRVGVRLLAAYGAFYMARRYL